MGQDQRECLADQMMTTPSKTFRSPPRLAAPGFSLIELLIVLAILGLIVAYAVPSYKNWIQSSQIRTAAESVQNGLQLARAEAVHQNTRVAFTVAGNNWSVDVVAPATNIQQGNNSAAAPNALLASTQNPITFNGLGQTVPPTNATITVTNAIAACQSAGGPARCLTVSVLAGGQTRLCDPNLPATDAQSC
jgi:type IV fimbrial biogenesis protein FimT